MEEQNQQDIAISDPLAVAQLEKLNLEIKSLKQNTKWEDRIIKLTPVITVLIAFAGLFFTVWQYQRNDALTRREQEKERINRIQSQIRADKEQLLEFITNKQISSVRAAFLIDDLDSLIEQLPDRELEKQIITEHLMRVAWELRFEEERDIDFDVSALRRWSGYRQFWKSNPGSHHVFLTKKYYSRIEHHHAQDPSCVENIDYDEQTTLFISRSDSKTCQEGLFPVLLYGFKEHLEALKETNNQELLRKEIEEFSRRTNKSPLAERLSATYLISKN
jgi:DNA repair exonuclease SbcCD ATPase subunit